MRSLTIFGVTPLSSAACGGADVAGFVALVTCPLGPLPHAARGLTAVLARFGPAGGDSQETRTAVTGVTSTAHPKWNRQPLRHARQRSTRTRDAIIVLDAELISPLAGALHRVGRWVTSWSGGPSRRLAG